MPMIDINAQRIGSRTPLVVGAVLAVALVGWAFAETSLGLQTFALGIAMVFDASPMGGR